ncbi:MAG TPA: sulfate/molybdate ABC transporter ATP-binding protein [Polyangiaceae bacterium]
MSVQVEGLTKRFGADGEVVGVQNVSFTAPFQRITSLLGPSGSGKSTLLRIIAGLEFADSGRVSINGEDITPVPVQDRKIGFVFQNYALFGHMTVFDNIAFGLTMRGEAASVIADRVGQLLELIRLSNYASRLPAQLSGGQRQRVALARALATEPKVLLLDEPFGALDTRVRVELRDWLHRLHEETHVTTILVTHDQEEALELSEHVVLLSDGRVVQAGSPQELYRNPKSGFVASFLGGAKVFRGSVQQGRAEFAHNSLSTEVSGLDGSVVEAFVRPHDVTLEKASPESCDNATAVIVRIVPVGSTVKVMLSLPDGDSLTVQLLYHEAQAKGFAPGDRVILVLRDVIVSPPLDYVI